MPKFFNPNAPNAMTPEKETKMDLIMSLKHDLDIAEKRAIDLKDASKVCVFVQLGSPNGAKVAGQDDMTQEIIKAGIEAMRKVADKHVVSLGKQLESLL